jgi:hypothetical protein
VHRLESETYIATVLPGGTVSLICQLFVNKLNNPEKIEPKHMNSTSNALGFLNVSSTMSIYNFSLTTSYRKTATYTAPVKNYDAFLENERKIMCEVSNFVCFIQLKVLFKPFVDASVPATQYFNESAMGQVECPIRAPSFPFLSHFLIWTTSDLTTSSTQKFSMKTYFFNLGLVNETMHNKIFICSLYGNRTRIFEERITLQVRRSKPEQSDFIVLWCLSAVFFSTPSR